MRYALSRMEKECRFLLVAVLCLASCGGVSAADDPVTLIFTGDRVNELKFADFSEFESVLVVRHSDRYLTLGTKPNDPRVIPIAEYWPGAGDYSSVAQLFSADCKDGKCFPTAKQAGRIVFTAPVKAVAKVNSERPRLLGRVFGRLRGGSCGCR